MANLIDKTVRFTKSLFDRRMEEERQKKVDNYRRKSDIYDQQEEIHRTQKTIKEEFNDTITHINKKKQAG